MQIYKFDKGKARGITSHPHIMKPSKPLKLNFQLSFGTIAAKISNINFVCPSWHLKQMLNWINYHRNFVS